MASTGFIERWYDAELEPPAVENREELEKREVERIRKAMSIVLLAGAIPRRLGGDASDAELAADRKRAKRVAHALRNALLGWTKKNGELPLDDELRRLGAQLDWSKFAEEHLATLQNELRCLATWAIRHEEHRWGRSAVVRLENELRWIEYALR